LVISERGSKKEHVFEEVSAFLSKNNAFGAFLPIKSFPQHLCEQLKGAGFKVGVWTANSTGEIQLAIRSDADFIITNHPDKARNLINLSEK